MNEPPPWEETEFRRTGVLDAWKKYGDRLSWGRDQCLAILDDGCDLSVPEWRTPLPWGDKVVAAYNSIDDNDDPSPVPPGYHGTSVGYPSSLHHGKRGVAYNDFVAHVRCVSIVHLTQDESATMARGLEWVIEHHRDLNITAVNLSPLDDQRHQAPVPTVIDGPLARLRELGVWVSAPCGNNSLTDGISWPACAEHCFAIGAVTPEADVVHRDRFANTDILVPAGATSSSNAYIVGSSMILREAIALARYEWQQHAANLADAMMAILKATGVDVHDSGTGLDFKRLDLLAALNHVFGE